MQPLRKDDGRTQRTGNIPEMEDAMALLGSFVTWDSDPLQSVAAGGLFLFLSILMICVFTFVSIAVWATERRKEREAYYKAEAMRRLAEMSGEGAKYAIEALREQERIEQGKSSASEVKQREGYKVGGLVNIGIGVGLYLMLREVNGPAMVGAIMVGIGAALLIYGLFMAPRHPLA
jgi:hypothetical protein